MRVRYLVSNIRQPGLGQSGMLTQPTTPPPGTSILPSLSLDTPPAPPSPSLDPKPMEMPAPQTPNPGAPSQMIQPASYPVVNQPAPVVPEPPAGPQPKWVNEGKNDLTRTFLATGTVAAIAAVGFALFK